MKNDKIKKSGISEHQYMDKRRWSTLAWYCYSIRIFNKKPRQCPYYLWWVQQSGSDFTKKLVKDDLNWLGQREREREREREGEEEEGVCINQDVELRLR